MSAYWTIYTPILINLINPWTVRLYRLWLKKTKKTISQSEVFKLLPMSTEQSKTQRLFIHGYEWQRNSKSSAGTRQCLTLLLEKMIIKSGWFSFDQLMDSSVIGCSSTSKAPRNGASRQCSDVNESQAKVGGNHWFNALLLMKWVCQSHRNHSTSVQYTDV